MNHVVDDHHSERGVEAAALRDEPVRTCYRVEGRSNQIQIPVEARHLSCRDIAMGIRHVEN